MRRLIILLLFCSISAYAADKYRIVHAEINETHSKNNYHISVRYPQISGMKNKNVQNKFNLHTYTLVLDAVNSFKKDMETWESSMPQYGSEFEINDTVMYKSASLISILLVGYYYYSSAAHPNTFFISINYDPKKNKSISFSDMFTGGYLSAISSYCINDLANKLGSDSDNGWINEGAGPKEDNFKVFNIIPGCLLITFPAYQVAAYVNGPQEVYVPFSNLSEYIRSDGALSGLPK